MSDGCRTLQVITRYQDICSCTGSPPDPWEPRSDQQWRRWFTPLVSPGLSGDPISIPDQWGRRWFTPSLVTSLSWPGSRQRQKLQTLLRRKKTYVCKKCKVGLHIPCFEVIFIVHSYLYLGLKSLILLKKFYCPYIFMRYEMIAHKKLLQHSNNFIFIGNDIVIF